MNVRASIPIFAIVALLLAAPSAFAWCLFGVGDTCGDASRETNTVSKYFNFNEPTPADSFDVFGIKKAVTNLFSPSKTATYTESTKPNTSTTKYKSGDTVTSKDTKGNSVTTTFKDVSFVQVGATDAWYYNLNVLKVNSHQCIGCGSSQEIPGFDYSFDISLRNTGNVAVDQPYTLEVIGEDSTGRLYYNSVTTQPGFPTGAGSVTVTLYDIGLLDKTTLDPQVIYAGTGDLPTVDFKVTVRIKDDDREVSPGFVQYEKKTKECKTKDGVTSCSTKTEMVTQTVHADYDDPFENDESQYFFTITKLTPELAGYAGLGIAR